MFNGNQQLAPDNPCKKCCLEYVFYQFESKIADAIVRFKVINIEFYFQLLHQMCITPLQKKKNHYIHVRQYIQCLVDKDVCN